uniref:PVII n=1 Tax=long-tailed grass lizard adenovirus 1 TaxID=1631550 RepID=A0A0H3VC17_9ADEN|nr:pVII [long-tailed grass lizard adenovirus 1]
MSILISPNDNTGWGVGSRLMRATGVRADLARLSCLRHLQGLGTHFSRQQPVRVRPYYRAQWGSLSNRVPARRLRRRLRMYVRQHQQRRRQRRNIRRRIIRGRRRRRTRPVPAVTEIAIA